MNIIEAVEVRKQYRDKVALDNVSMNIPQGAIFGLLGPNGAGKTTFIRILTQITAPDSGYVLMSGQKLNRKDVDKIGYLPEERGLYKKMKVGEQALYLAQLKGLDARTAKAEITKWFDKFEITSWWNKKVEELSKGMAQKVQFIATVVHKPKLLIFDEPFSGFDPINVNLLKSEILNLKNQGATIIFSTHNMTSVEEICDEIALIDHAKIVLSGKVSALKRQFAGDMYSFELELPGDRNQSVIDEMQNKLMDVIVEDNILKGRISANCLGNISGCVREDETSGNTAKTTNYMVQYLMQAGNLINFNEILPSMNDIFIQTVTKAENTKNE